MIGMTTHNLTTLSNATATRISPVGVHSGTDITVQNIHATAVVYIGGTGVTAADYGYRLSPGAAISWELSGRSSLYAISDTNNSKVAILNTGLEAGQ